jgi:hypothetical protein
VATAAQHTTAQLAAQVTELCALTGSQKGSTETFIELHVLFKGGHPEVTKSCKSKPTCFGAASGA